SANGKLSYTQIDAIDSVSHRPDFALLIYPWNIYDAKKGALISEASVPKNCPPTYLVHTDDDRSTSLGAVMFYVGVKKQGVPAAIHVYGNGGHGYGLRPVKGSEISTWPKLATNWLVARGVARAKP
ncbi:MAG: alpha/beta hydrolase, partial [Planctomycetota bacterium]